VIPRELDLSPHSVKHQYSLANEGLNKILIKCRSPEETGWIEVVIGPKLKNAILFELYMYDSLRYCSAECRKNVMRHR